MTVALTCQQCDAPMTGRSDRKYCDACRKRRIHHQYKPEYHVRAKAKRLGIAPSQVQVRTRLSPDQVNEIRRRRAAGDPARVLATEFGVQRRAINRCVSGQSWKDL